MNLEIQAEEPSAERARSVLAPRIIGPRHDFAIRLLRSKRELLTTLTGRLIGYSSWVREADTKVVVLVDHDNEDCALLKGALEKAAADAGLATLSTARAVAAAIVLNRIVIEELEAWLFGDVPALRAAYPRLPAGLESQLRYQSPEAVAGGTWEALEGLLQRHGYFSAGLAKTVAAAEIARHMSVESNRAKGFQVFRDGLRRLVGKESNA